MGVKYCKIWKKYQEIILEKIKKENWYNIEKLIETFIKSF